MQRLSTSVAMCTCNGSRFLRDQLRSIATQTVSPGELIISDDASSDDSVAIVTEFGKHTPFPVRLFQNRKRVGPAKNFESVIRRCAGEIILLSDQDDVWQPFKIERVLSAFDRNRHAAYAFSDAEVIDERGCALSPSLWQTVGLSERLEEFTGSGQLEVLLRHNLITGATMAFRNSLRDVLLPLPADWMHDYWIALLGSTIAQGLPIRDRLMKYRRHASQVCGWRKMNFFSVCKASLKTGTEDWTDKVVRFRELLKRVDQIPNDRKCDPSRLKLLQEKEIHISSRAKIRSSMRIVRFLKVLAEASTGRYHRFSNSWYSIVRDL